MSKRSRTYSKMYPIRKKPRQRHVLSKSQPMVFDMTDELDQLIVRHLGISNMTPQYNANPNSFDVPTEYFVSEEHMTLEMLQLYKEACHAK